MTHEEREALRGLGKDAWFIYVNGKTLDSIRLIALLDALDEAERQIGIAKKECPNGGNDGYITPRPCQMANCEDCHAEHEATTDGIKADRDHYKARAEAAEARAEALERAYRELIQRRNGISPWCLCCKHFNELGNEHEYAPSPLCVNCDTKPDDVTLWATHWQFDQARFTKGGERDG